MFIVSEILSQHHIKKRDYYDATEIFVKITFNLKKLFDLRELVESCFRLQIVIEPLFL